MCAWRCRYQYNIRISSIIFVHFLLILSRRICENLNFFLYFYFLFYSIIKKETFFFSILIDSDNYMSWVRHMIFVFSNLRIWEYSTKEWKFLFALNVTENDDEKRRNKSFQRKETRANYKKKCRKMIEKKYVII